MAELHGKVALVSGASSGIGATAAVALAQEGMDVALLARNRKGLERVAQQVREAGRQALVLVCDVTDQDAVNGAIARTEEHLGGLDLLVSNHAAVVFGRFDRVGKEDFDRTLDVTFTGAVNLIRASLPALHRSEGDIVVVGSIMTKVPLPSYSSYAASKHALRGFLGSLRVELKSARSPVRVSLVNPGAVDTPLWDHTTSAQGKRSNKPPDSYKPEVVADAIVHCAKHPHEELDVGSHVVALGLLWTVARPVGELVLTLAHRFYQAGKHEYEGGGSLWDAVGVGGVSSETMSGRPSLTMPLRYAIEAPIRVLTGR
jgi:NAD(P)-dependent dehydrogenase (short-subunit alcohol dehydrogenase family)